MSPLDAVRERRGTEENHAGLDFNRILQLGAAAPASSALPPEKRKLADVSSPVPGAGKDEAGTRELMPGSVSNRGTDSPRHLLDCASSSKYPSLSTALMPSDAVSFKAKAFFQAEAGSVGTLPELCQTEKICTVGEDHTDLGAKEYFTSHIDGLARKGYKLFGLEMVKQSDQALLDRYIQDGIGREELLSQNVLGGFDYAQSGPKHYLMMLDAIREHNQRTGENLKVFAMDIEYSDPTQAMAERNQRWAQKIDQMLKENPEAKVVTYSGKGHIGKQNKYSNSVNSELEKLGHRSTSVSLDSYDPSDAQWPGYGGLVAKGANEDNIKCALSYPIGPGYNGEERAKYGVVVPWKSESPQEIGKNTTKTFDLHSFDDDAKLYVTTGEDGQPIRLRYTGGSYDQELAPQSAKETTEGTVVGNGWFVGTSAEGKREFAMYRAGIPIVRVDVFRSGSLMIFNNPKLLFPPVY
jgi:hypothetical protein